MSRRWRRSLALVVTAATGYAVVVFLAVPVLPLWVTASAAFNVVAALLALVVAKRLVLDGGFDACGIDPFGLDDDERTER